MSDLKEKIREELDNGIRFIHEPNFSELADDITNLFNLYAAERAVAFAEWCKDGWLINNDGSYFHETSKQKVGNTAELYQLFDNETKQK